jgi:hypothetical protein
LIYGPVGEIMTIVKQSPFRLVAAFAAVCMLAGAGATAASAQRGRALTEAERAACLAARGRVQIGGLLGNEICVRPTSDAGRRCTSSSQCEAMCLYEPRSGLRQTPRPGARVTGRCQRETNAFGCRQAVERGRLQPALCVD